MDEYKPRNAMDFLLILIILALVLGYYTASGISHIVNNSTSNEEEYHMPEILTRLYYAWGLEFRFRIVVDGEISNRGMAIWQITRAQNPFYTEIVFVRSEEESKDFPDNIIVAWPSDREDVNNRLINEMHREVNRRPEANRPLLRPIVSLEEFGLSYPITVDDFIDNWEKIRELRIALGILGLPSQR